MSTRSLSLQTGRSSKSQRLLNTLLRRSPKSILASVMTLTGCSPPMLSKLTAQPRPANSMAKTMKFRVFLDLCRIAGRLLMKRREAIRTRQEGVVHESE